MAKKKWKKLEEVKAEKETEEKKPTQEEIVKAMTKARAKRPVIRSSHR